MITIPTASRAKQESGRSPFDDAYDLIGTAISESIRSRKFSCELRLSDYRPFHGQLLDLLHRLGYEANWYDPDGILEVRW